MEGGIYTEKRKWLRVLEERQPDKVLFMENNPLGVLPELPDARVRGALRCPCGFGGTE
jgi:hypothetical protein